MELISSIINDKIDSVFVDGEIKTGFKDLDKIMSFKKSNLYVIASRPGVYKTSLLINLALNIALTNKNVYFFTLDYCKEQIIKMMASCYTNIRTINLLTNDLNAEERLSLKIALDKLSKLPIYLEDDSRNSKYVIDEINQIKNGIVLIDGFEYLDISDDEIGSCKMILNKTNYQVRCNNAYKLKRAAIKSQIPVVVTCYVPRLPKDIDRELEIKDLDRVGTIANEADTVMFLEDICSTSVIKVNMGKLERCTGEIGYAYLKHNYCGCRIEDCYPEQSFLIDTNEELRKERQD